MLHSKFLAENKGTSVSLSSFRRLRPAGVLTVDKNNFISCLCEYCLNLDHKVNDYSVNCKILAVCFHQDACEKIISSLDSNLSISLSCLSKTPAFLTGKLKLQIKIVVLSNQNKLIIKLILIQYVVRSIGCFLFLIEYICSVLENWL